MRRSEIGKTLAALVIFACAPSAASPALIGLALGLAHAHGHLVSLVNDEGHVDLVLAHVEGDPPHHGAPHRERASGAFSESDHVFHLTSSDATFASRRGDVAASAAEFAVCATALPFASARSHLHPPPDRRADRADAFKSVVLRL